MRDQPQANSHRSTGSVQEEKPASCVRRVLIVDDEAGILTALQRLFRREDFELLTANSASRAIELLEENTVQLVISDHRMPGMTGAELLHEIKKRWPDPIRIILSGYSEVNAIIGAINKGEIYKFITKPWNDEEIKLHVQRALEQYDLRQDNIRLADRIGAQNQQLQTLNAMLEQRASDASTGLSSMQDLLEDLCVGVLSVDQAGLVVGANRSASRIVSSHSQELIGVPVSRALPEPLSEVVLSMNRLDTGCASGRFELDRRSLQYCITPLHTHGKQRGIVVALWEEVS